MARAQQADTDQSQQGLNGLGEDPWWISRAQQVDTSPSGKGLFGPGDEPWRTDKVGRGDTSTEQQEFFGPEHEAWLEALMTDDADKVRSMLSDADEHSKQILLNGWVDWDTFTA